VISSLSAALNLPRECALGVYYSSQIVLMGAEFTNVYARRYGSLRRTLSSMQNRND
jgi:uncharacterized BrkB/YihY/UPF0761 family membrane protein